MGRCIIAAAPGVDLYGEWSTFVDGFTFVGTRAELIEYGIAPERIDRAHSQGSSALDSTLGKWSRDGFLVLDGGESEGWLPRPRLHAYLAALHRDARATADALLDPVENDDEDGGS